MPPFIFVLAGVNGAGKSSVGGALLRQHGLDWFNPDAYARELVRELRMDIHEANARAWDYGKRGAAMTAVPPWARPIVEAALTAFSE